MNYKEQVAVLQQQIYKQEYFVNLWEHCLFEHGLSKQLVASGVYKDAKLNLVLNDFWFALPDAPHIRVDPFFLLCDLCELQ